jgi:hypothetical protein
MGDARLAFDAAPGPDGCAVFFSAIDGAGLPAVYKTAVGGTATRLGGSPLLLVPSGLAVNSTGGSVYIADPETETTPGVYGALFTISATGTNGTAEALPGTAGKQPVGVAVARLNGTDVVYFTGREPNGAGAVYSLPAAGGAATTVFVGNPLVDPSSVAVTDDGAVYVSDSANGGAVYQLKGNTATLIRGGLTGGFPAGLAVSRDGTGLSIAARGAASRIDRVDLVTTAGTSFSAGLELGNDPAGLHRAVLAEVYAFVDQSAGPSGAVYLLKLRRFSSRRTLLCAGVPAPRVNEPSPPKAPMRRSAPFALALSLVSGSFLVVACGDDDPAPVPAARTGGSGGTSSAGAAGSTAAGTGGAAGTTSTGGAAGTSAAGAAGTSAAGAGGAAAAGAGGTSAAGAGGTAAAGAGGTAGIGAPIWRSLVFTGTGFAVHDGAKIAVSVTRDDTKEVVAGKVVAAQSGDSFSFSWPGLLAPGVTYNVDYYADANGNKACDAPTADHVWRRVIAPTDTGALTVTHDANWINQCPSFSTLASRRSLTFKGTGFAVHTGRRVDVVVSRTKDGAAIAHSGYAALEGDALSFGWEGLLEVGEAYTVDYFADNNGDGTCNAPPDDHVWRQSIPAVTGDVALAVVHDTNWVNVCSSFAK